MPMGFNQRLITLRSRVGFWGGWAPVKKDVALNPL